MNLWPRIIGPEETEKETTQRDQFNTEDVLLAEALVREAHQNSLDAARAKAVRTRLAVHDLDPARGAALLSFLDRPQLERHLQASSIDTSALIWDSPKVLVVEDFGTTGLIGAVDKKDSHPFSDFWRRIGRSHKAGGDGGRWGLGKLVFSSASRIRTFFGLTIQIDDPSRTMHLMGQTLLSTHQIGEQDFDGVLYYANVATNGLRVPESEPVVVQRFREATGIRRVGEPGLSIAIPFVREDLTEALLLTYVCQNYFFPILASKLEVEIGSVLLNSESYASFASLYGGAKLSDGGLIGFVKQVASQTAAVPSLTLGESWTKLDCLGISKEALETLRDLYFRSEVVHVRAPITLKRKTQAPCRSYFDLFLRRPSDVGSGGCIFVRGALTLPTEAKKSFPYSDVFAAFVATDGVIASFLGDAENPAHTSWSGTAEKVAASWVNPRDRLKEIRTSLRLLYAAINENVERTDAGLLIDTFSVAGPPGIKKPANRGSIVKRPPVPQMPRKPARYRIGNRHGGFSVVGTAVADASEYPLTLRARFAYDVARGDPFKRYTTLDFDYARMAKSLTASNAEVVVDSSNSVLIRALTPAFRVDVEGFDPNRDLVIRVGEQDEAND